MDQSRDCAAIFKGTVPNKNDRPSGRLRGNLHTPQSVCDGTIGLERERMFNKKEILKLAKGFRGRSKNCIRAARDRVEKALQYAYRDRRNKKRDMRGLWIQRINAGSRQYGVNYGQLMCGLNKENIQLNRKVLSELAMHEPYSFKTLVQVAKAADPRPGLKQLLP